MIKFLIVGENSIDKIPLIDLLLKNEGKFKVANIFSTNKEEAAQKYHTYITNQELNICHKNNVIVYVKTIVSDSYGITFDEYDESNILFMNTEDFNNISNRIFLSNDELVIVWLDTKNHDEQRIKYEMKETKYMQDNIIQYNLKYLYFLDCDNIEIMDVICEYLEHPEKREEILENYS
jgi:hypothetical protein